MTQLSLNIEEDWFSVDLETKLNKKIDILQSLVYQQLDLINKLSEEINTLKCEVISIKTMEPHEKMLESLSEEIKILKGELHSTQNKSASQNDHTHQLLEELKILKQRELNLMLRERIPTPFVSANQLLSLPNPFLMNTLRFHKRNKDTDTNTDTVL